MEVEYQFARCTFMAKTAPKEGRLRDIFCLEEQVGEGLASVLVLREDPRRCSEDWTEGQEVPIRFNHGRDEAFGPREAPFGV